MNDVIKWLESPAGEAWSERAHNHVYRPLLSAVLDGDPSSLMGDFYPLWLA